MNAGCIEGNAIGSYLILAFYFLPTRESFKPQIKFIERKYVDIDPFNDDGI